MKITVHCIVKNEDCWVWFAINSVLPFVEQILIYDTGSEDKTVDIIKSIKSPKIIFEEKGSVEAEGLVSLRQEQVNRTETDWFLILDGDEIWPKKQFEILIKAASKCHQNTPALFNRVRNSIGDVYHYLPESAGKYEINRMRGNLNIRMIRKSADLKIIGEYPLESFTNVNGPIDKQKDIKFVDCWYLHTTFLKRSSKDKFKKSGSFGKKKLWEKGIKLQQDELPEVFFKKRPEIVQDPLIQRGRLFNLVSQVTTPLIFLKRKLI